MQVGETAAFDAVHALACCLPGALGKHALAVSCALRLIEMHQQGEHPIQQARGVILWETCEVGAVYDAANIAVCSNIPSLACRR